MAADGAARGVTLSLHATVAVQDDVGRGLGRTTLSGEPALPVAWASLGLNPSYTVLLLKADLLQDTSIVYEHAGLLRSKQPVLAGLPAQQATRMGVEFRPVSVTSKVPVGAFRLQVSGNSSLVLRPRSGGMTLSWRAQF